MSGDKFTRVGETVFLKELAKLKDLAGWTAADEREKTHYSASEEWLKLESDLASALTLAVKLIAKRAGV